MSAESVKKWRATTKSRIIDAFGGSCCICGYSRCNSALELHHLDPDIKEFGFGSIRASAKSWNRLCAELRKCVLVCANCHREIHDEAAVVPDKAKRFDEKYADYKLEDYFDECPVCGNSKSKNNVTCSYNCAAKLSRKVDWDSIDLQKLMNEYSNVQIGRMLGVSDKAVHKRAKKLGIRKQQ